MANETVLQKATLVQVKPDFLTEDTSAKDRSVVVQFNPETLKVSFANQLQQPDGAGDKRGTQGTLFVGAGTTKMTCTLWFDVTAPQPPQQDPAWKDVDDVRKLTNRVSYFITPKPDPKDTKKFIPPAVRFEWGSFRFAGILESVEESLEFFSPEGRPLRANVAIAISQQKVIVFPPEQLKGAPKRTPGTRPTTPVPQGSSVQKMAGQNWQLVASLNGIENPRLPAVGSRLDLGVSRE
jgi:Contractile injection system tube protein